MPYKIVRDDITRVKADAIVNAANEQLRMGGGVCGAIFSAAGERKLQAACNKIGHCATGSAVATPAYKLPARYVIHAVGPVWHGGDHGEQELLASCYRESLKLAASLRCKSIAFPLISAGIYGYPRKEALQVAQDEIRTFLQDHEMDVTLVLFDTTTMDVADDLRMRVASYIDDVYVRDSGYDARRNWEMNAPAATPTASQPLGTETASPTAGGRPRHYCMQCGFELKTGSSYCPCCGSPVPDAVLADMVLSEPASHAGPEEAASPEPYEGASYDASYGDAASPMDTGFFDLDALEDASYTQSTAAPSAHSATAPSAPSAQPMAAPSMPAPQPWADHGAPAPSYGAPAYGAPAAGVPAAGKPKGKRARISLPNPLRNLLAHLDAGFSETLLAMIDERGLKDSQVYKRANISRQHFSKMRSNPAYKPTKTTVLALAVALELSLDETCMLLERAGFALSHADRRDNIVEFFIKEGNYDIFQINDTLFAFDQPLLG